MNEKEVDCSGLMENFQKNIFFSLQNNHDGPSKLIRLVLTNNCVLHVLVNACLNTRYNIT